MRTCLIICLILFSCSSLSIAEFYKWTDARGQVHFSDTAPVNNQAESIELNEITTYTSVSVSDISMNFDSRAGSQADSDMSAEKPLRKNKKVVIYSAVWCGICTRAKKYFRSRKITFTEYDIETSKKGRRDFIKLKARGVPVILVGKKRMNGFDVRKFEAMY